MKRTTRATITLLAAVTTALVGAVALAPAAHAEDPIGVGGTPPTDTVARTADNAAGLAGAMVSPGCRPTWMEVRIHDPFIDPYIGAKSALYRWSVRIDIDVPECQSNLVTVTAALSDQAMDGTSPATPGQPATERGWGRATVVAELPVPYAHTSVGYHEFTARFVAADAASRVICAGSRTWLYWPTSAGPVHAGSRTDLDHNATTITCFVT